MGLDTMMRIRGDLDETKKIPSDAIATEVTTAATDTVRETRNATGVGNTAMIPKNIAHDTEMMEAKNETVAEDAVTATATTSVVIGDTEAETTSRTEAIDGAVEAVLHNDAMISNEKLGLRLL